MKTSFRTAPLIAVILPLMCFAGWKLAHAQDTSVQDGTTSLADTNVDWNSMSDFEVELQALEMTTPIPASELPDGGVAGTFWSAQHAEDWPPLPTSFGLSAWPLGDGTFVLNDTNVNYATPVWSWTTSLGQTAGGMRKMYTMESVGMGGDGSDSGGNGVSPTNTANYGTNLWLSITGVSNHFANLFLENTAPDIQYEIQSRQALTQTGWVSEGFVWGSELTNRTPMNVAQNNRTNLFFRIRSWADDGSGLPIWWQLQYFGTTGVNPNAFDSAGDGWTIYQKFQMGLNPNVFYTPPTPQGLAVSYNDNNDTATLNWLPSPGPVASYTVTITDRQSGLTTNINVSAGTQSLTYSLPDNPYNIVSYGPVFLDDFDVQANYTGGASLASSLTSESSYPPLFSFPGPQGSAYLALSPSILPPGTTAVRLTRIDFYAENYYGNSAFDTNWIVPISAFTNGLYLIPAFMQTAPVDSYGQADYDWWVETINAQGGANCQALNAGYQGFSYSQASTTFIQPPYYDGRAQLKQNLIFLLRQPNETNSFELHETFAFATTPNNYVFAGLYDFADSAYPDYGAFTIDALRPFEENYLYRNFVFTTTNVNTSGAITTGVSNDDFYMMDQLTSTPTFLYQSSPTNGATISSLLATNQTQWLCTYPLNLAYGNTDTNFVGFYGQLTFPNTWTLASNPKNYWGLPYLSAKLAYGSGGSLATTTLSPGNSFSVDNPNVYMETVQPKFQTAEYDFWQVGSGDALPGLAGFSPTNASRLMIDAVGNLITIAGYAKLSVTNSYYSSVYGYLGQYFDEAYQINTNGITTTNTTGVFSSYGDFFPTNPGPAALVTMPDVDTGARGTCTVYAVSLALDANHDGNMDTSFNGADATSPSSPYTHWCDNNYDRLTLDADDNVYYDDDVKVQGSPGTIDQNTPDCNYLDGAGHRVIPCERDLQDFARLWVCGVTSNLLAALPSGSTVTLNWGDVGSPNSGNPTIDLFQAADADGGIGYLTNSTIADAQIDSLTSAYVGRLAPGGSIQLNASLFFGWAGNHFIWCGVTNGSGQLNLTIADASGNVLAQASQWIQIVDIKQMYERCTVGDNTSLPVLNVATNVSDGLPIGVPAFQYTSPQNTNTSYILFVHGWNIQSWEKDRFAESAFKRLYWQGYQGRFGEFRWPTGFGFTGGFWDALTDPRNFDNSEYQAWQSATGLMNKLNDLNAEYPGHVYMLAHSMGNVVAGEALRLAAQNGDGQLVNTYVASQAALSAHNYDSTVTSPYLLPFTYKYPFFPLSSLGTNNYGPYAPDIYGNRLTNNVAAAGKRISFYNENDFALAMPRWGFDQITKPDGSYFYTGSLSDPSPWNKFAMILNDGATNTFDIVNSLGDRYTVLAYAAPSYSTALGATPNVLNISQNLDLTTIWPTDTSGHNYADHFWHSAEFRGDCWQEWNYWNTLLRSSSEGFNISSP